MEARRASLIASGASYIPANKPPPADLSRAVYSICVQLPPRRAARVLPHVAGYLTEADLERLLRWVSAGWRGRPLPFHLSPAHANRDRIQLAAERTQHGSPFAAGDAAPTMDVEAGTEGAAGNNPPAGAEASLAEHFNHARKRLRMRILTGERDDAVDRTFSRHLLRAHRRARREASLLRLLISHLTQSPRMRGIHRLRVRADILDLADAAYTGVTPRWRSADAPVASETVARWVWAMLQGTGAGVLTSEEPLARALARVAAKAGGEHALPASDLAKIDSATARLRAALPAIRLGWSRRVARDAEARVGIKPAVVWEMVNQAGWRVVLALAVHVSRRTSRRRRDANGAPPLPGPCPWNGKPLPMDAAAVLARYGLVVEGPPGPLWFADLRAVAARATEAFSVVAAVFGFTAVAAVTLWAFLIR